jgi:glucosamine--fructose-6-phosphate aminotransferase (isomerizing)
MCGIVGSIGKKQAYPIVIDGLRALEYRGYDSAGVALLVGNNKARLFKQIGGVDNVAKLIDSAKTPLNSTVAIGHTRWATHGQPSVGNAHPHTNMSKNIFVVHNGIIENYAEVRQKLIEHGYKFVSETDTEVIPQLIDFHLKSSSSFEEAFRITLGELQGAYAIVALTTTEPDKLFAARLSSPLVIGVAENEMIVASDPSAILQHTKSVVYLKDYEMVVIDGDNYTIHNFLKDKGVRRGTEELDFDSEEYSKAGFSTYMLKEIYEAPATIKSATLGRVRQRPPFVKLGGLEAVAEQLKFIDRMVIVACGTSYYAGLVGEYLFEEIAKMPVEVQLASEFKYRDEPFSRSTALLAISQSGETADTIAALKKVEDYGILRLGVVNAVGSTVARMTDAGVYCHAGPERAVASTKAFISQVVVLAEIALYLCNGSNKLYKPLINELELLPEKANQLLKDTDEIKRIALKYKNDKDFLFIGRHYMYPAALEGALKLKEVAYTHAEGYAAGEMKHGPLAMIDPSFPTLALATDSPQLEKTYSNIAEIKARHGRVVAIATEGNEQIPGLVDDVIYIPRTVEQFQPILAATVMQLFAYFIAEARGVNIDQPRNLAKSVTVE